MKPNQPSSRSFQSILWVLVLLGAALNLGVNPVFAAPLFDPPSSQPGSYRIYLPAVQSITTADPLPQDQPVTEESFAAQVADGNQGAVRGVYVQEILALQVEQQPTNNPGYVGAKPGWATQFEMATQYGVIGLLAHNNLSGELYFDLKPGDVVSIIYGNGTRVHYRVTEIDQFKALQPNNPNSKFQDLKTGDTLSAGQLFGKVYTGGDHVTFQTCIARDGAASWGRLFVIAEPVEE